jgi:rhamnopyranosyl-N-acetylglucosaminyl-diphospho-decaprenol beta-1,3/1,4-galactofuranosyltransferase
MDQVCALVVTRNRKELLLECLAGLSRMTHPVSHTVIVDSGSTDGTEAQLRERGVLDDPAVTFVRLERNVGSAGSYAAGIEAAREQPADWIWLMDDDAEAHPDALELLLSAPEARRPDTAALACAVTGPSGDVDRLHRGRMRRFLEALPLDAYRPGVHSQLGFSSYTGLMVRTDVARAIDPPRADFFFWNDDVEYSLRLRSRGRIVLVPESRVLHKHQMGGEADTRRSRFWNRLLDTSYPSAPWESYWKNLSGVRNFFWIKHHYGHVTPLAFAGMVAVYVVRTLMFERRPFRRIPWLVKAALAGRRGEPLGLTPERWAEITARGARVRIRRSRG